jgi:ABC-type Fe3+/spermidine/putrescine transport system ATPase subunit
VSLGTARAGAEPLLRISGVTKRFGGHVAVDHVSLDIHRGEFFALLGGSGSGKSTLLRMLAGLLQPDAGRILLDGQDMAGVPAYQRPVNMMFQSYALFPHMSVAQNIGYGLRLRKKSRADIAKRVGDMVAMLKLDGLAERNVTQLSGGQRQRVALGRALAVDPQILLLDEPLSNLDARIREDVRHEIKALQRRLGITAIHVTHDREEAMVMADRIVILDAGQIAQVGRPEDVYNRPVSPFVASFMGANNAIRLDLSRAGAKLRVAPGPHNRAAELAHDGAIDGKVTAHFRSEAAKLAIAGDTDPQDALALEGRIVQAAYPGGFWRYAVAVGERQFMVDDDRRVDVGVNARVVLPAEALHFFRAEA